MASNTDPVFEKLPYSKGVTFTNADSANTKKDLVPAADVPAEGLRVDQISLTSTETANARAFAFYDHDGSTSFLIGTVNVPVLSGFDGSAPLIDALPLLAPNLGYLMLMTGHKLEVENLTQPASGKTITAVARGGKLTA
jgi:hypothetical protein